MEGGLEKGNDSKRNNAAEKPQIEASEKQSNEDQNTDMQALEEERFLLYKKAVELERKKIGADADVNEKRTGLSPQSTRELLKHMTPDWDQMSVKKQDELVAKGFGAGDWKLTPGQRQIRDVENKFRRVKVALQREIELQNESVCCRSFYTWN